MPETAADADHNFDATPELFADMTKTDIVHVLEYLCFPKNGSVLIRIDRPVRDYLINRLSERH